MRLSFICSVSLAVEINSRKKWAAQLCCPFFPCWLLPKERFSALSFCGRLRRQKRRKGGIGDTPTPGREDPAPLTLVRMGLPSCARTEAKRGSLHSLLWPPSAAEGNKRGNWGHPKPRQGGPCTPYVGAYGVAAPCIPGREDPLSWCVWGCRPLHPRCSHELLVVECTYIRHDEVEYVEEDADQEKCSITGECPGTARIERLA
jgi:hypothetical protein